jgi:hypothetical protein
VIKAPIEHVRSAAGRWRTNKQAADALGINSRTFTRLCREHGIETPFARGRRERGLPVHGSTNVEVVAEGDGDFVLVDGDEYLTDVGDWMTLQMIKVHPHIQLERMGDDQAVSTQKEQELQGIHAEIVPASNL